MAQIPQGSLGITGVTLGAIRISLDFDKVGFSMGQSASVGFTPAVARNLAEWLNFFAESADETAARVSAIGERK